MDEIILIIQNVGFPIVACVYMAKQNQETVKAIQKMNEALLIMNEKLEQIKKGDK